MELPDLTLENINSKQTPEEITAMVLEKLLGNIWVVLAENEYTQQLKALGEDIANQAAEALKESGKALQKEIDSLLSETRQNVQNALDEGKKELQNAIDEGKKEVQKEIRNTLKELLPTPKRKNSKDKK
jgi:F0F1-type ATP synthase membrane subunit b/b'